jgi:hypothetical protein
VSEEKSKWSVLLGYHFYRLSHVRFLLHACVQVQRIFNVTQHARRHGKSAVGEALHQISSAAAAQKMLAWSEAHSMRNAGQLLEQCLRGGQIAKLSHAVS